MKTKTRKRLLFMAIACLVVAAIVIGCVTLGPHIDEKRVEQIRNGMTLDEVIAILRAPPGDYRMDREKEIWYDHHLRAHISVLPPLDTNGTKVAYKQWATDNAAVAVWFNEEGSVVGRSFLAYNLSFRDRLYHVWRRMTRLP